MKKYIGILTILFMTSVVLVACGNDDNSNNQEPNENTGNKTEESNSSSDDNSRGYENEENNGLENEDTSNNANDDKNDTDKNEKDPKSGIYDPEEVSGKQEPDQDGNFVDPEVLKNLELPYIYENTIVYNGTVNPEQEIRFELPMKNIDTTESIDVDVTDDGHFSIPLSGADLKDGEEITVYIMNNMPHEQQFKLPIQSEEEGMEVVPRKSGIIDEIEGETYLPDFYANTNAYYGKTMRDAEVTVVETNMGDSMDMEVDEEGNFSGSDFANFPYVEKGKASLQEGDTLIFMITDEKGYSTYIEKEVLSNSDDPDYTEPVSQDEE